MNTINAARAEVRGLDDLPAVVATPPCVAAPCHVADVLERAADYMELHGKCEGEFHNADGQVCAIGAMFRTSDCIMTAELALIRCIRNSNVEVWSDSHDQATVVSTMRACAALERMKQP